jgi:hypothetical protein
MAKRNKGPKIASHTPTFGEISMRAHQKWINHGCVNGHAEQDWLEAEAELKSEQSPSMITFNVIGISPTL